MNPNMMPQMAQPTIEEVVNDDGSVTRTTTTVMVQTLTPAQVQARQAPTSKTN